MVCHLIAIAKIDGEKTLKYIIFRPKYIGYSKLEDTYTQLDDVKRQIENASRDKKTPIGKYCDEYKITIKFKYVQIENIRDFNYEETYGIK